jgi:hypothetical protein
LWARQQSFALQKRGKCIILKYKQVSNFKELSLSGEALSAATAKPSFGASSDDATAPKRNIIYQHFSLPFNKTP